MFNTAINQINSILIVNPLGTKSYVEQVILSINIWAGIAYIYLEVPNSLR